MSISESDAPAATAAANQVAENTIDSQRQLNWPLFRQHLLDNLADGVIFVDPQGSIRTWNRQLETMTGMIAAKVMGQKFKPALIELSGPTGEPIEANACPLARCLRTGQATSGEYRITGRSGREVKVEVSFVPTTCAKGLIHGAIMLFHDYTVQLDLQRQLQDLYEFSTLDPLTQVANRSEFERVLEEFVRANKTTDFCCSLIICDIDFFKQINDNYNHHVGDQALVAFASLLKKFVRSKDIVARYGGEEFVILCANCDAASARQRAEEIRIELTQTPQPMLDNKCITASFGVSELLSEDTPTDLFVRADTALLTAKEEGRNRVVCQTGTLEVDSVAVDSDKSISETGLAWSNQTKAVLESGEFQTITPVPLMVTKLRGYILEKDAELKHVDSDSISMQIEFEDPRNYGRRGRFLVDIEFQSQANRSQSAATRAVQSITYLRIAIREAATRKWFSTNCTEVAPDLMRELRDFLMIASEDDKVMVDRATDPTVKR